MRISEAASRSGLSIDTIRFYEKSGLLPSIGRGADGRRWFSSENVEWLVLLSSLRDTGMPMKTMQHFAELYRKGDTELSPNGGRCCWNTPVVSVAFGPTLIGAPNCLPSN